MTETSSFAAFDLAAALPEGRLLIEASAGTGKTYSLTALIARYIAEAGVRTDQLLVVTFTRAAAAELREQTRARLTEALAALDGHAGSADDSPWLRCITDVPDESGSDRDSRRVRLADALATIDAAAITTIHGFFQSALGELGVRSGAVGTGTLVEDQDRLIEDQVQDLLVSRLAEDPEYFQPLANREPDGQAKDLRSVLKELTSNLGSVAAPDVDADRAASPPAGDSAGESDDQLALRLSAQAATLVRQLRAARIASGALSYDDLITGLVGLLDDPDLGAAVKAALLSRYRVVLIDEFQDTDVVQWRLFDEVFPHDPDPEVVRALIAVGDPKQAIYRFRGADVSAYLRARAQLPRQRMTVNWRSDASIIEVLNRWLDGRSFGDPEIAYEPVLPRPGAPVKALRGGGAPVQLRWLPSWEPLPRDSKKKVGEQAIPAPAAQRRVAKDVADHIVMLLRSGEIVTGPEGGETVRPVRPADICILVRGHAEGDLVANALNRVGIPAVRSRVGSVLETEAVDQWRILLSALRDPADARAVRAAMLGWFMGHSATDLDDDRLVEEAQQRCAHWAEQLTSSGMAMFHQRLRTEPQVMAAMAAAAEAERRITDVEHIAELVDAVTSGRQVSPRSVLATLEVLAADPMQGEADARRVDSDAKAVQVTTIHSSKGLEYPIVLLPFPKGATNAQPYVYLDGDDRRVDAAPSVTWGGDGGSAKRKSRAAIEIAGDELRLLYVALTRARHQLVVWWYRYQQVGSSPLTRLLFGSTAEGLDKSVTMKDFRKTLTGLAEELGREFAFSELASAAPDTPHYVSSSPIDAAGLTVATPPPTPLARRTWNRWSYSAVVKGVRDQEAPWAHGSDQPAEGDDAGSFGPDAMGMPLAGGLVSQPAGKAFGNFVHATFEHLDPAAPDLNAAVEDAMAAAPAWQRLGVDAASCVEGIADVVLTPLDPLPDGVRLRDIRRSDLLPEMPFHLGLADASATVAVADLARLVVDDPVFGDYFTRLAADTDGFNISGLLTGSIDVVLRVPGDGAPLHCVADYKTNRLHPRDLPAMTEHYGVGSMRVGMEHGDYPTQALIYLVALHRFLVARLDGYDPDRHLGPALYLFVRGMTGPDTPVLDDVRNGVFAWRPSTAAIVAASRLLAGGSVPTVGGPNGGVG